MNQRINSHNKPEKTRNIYQNKTIKYITVQRIKSKNRNMPIFSDKDKEEKSNLCFSETIKNSNGGIIDKRKMASHSNITNINKEKKSYTKPFLYSINNSYRSKKLKHTNSNSYLIAGGPCHGGKGANKNKNKTKPKIKFNKISNTLSSHEIKDNKNIKKFNTIIHNYNSIKNLSNIHVINHTKKRCIYDKIKENKEDKKNKEDKENKEEHINNKENKENINSNLNTNTYNTISINHDFGSFIVKKNKKINATHTHRNKAKVKNINTNITIVMSKKNFETPKDIIYNNNNDTANTFIIKKNNSALLTFGNANNDSLSESLSKTSNSNNKFLLILKQENENLKNELKKTKEKVDVLENKIDNLIYGKKIESVRTLILNSRNDIASIKGEHKLGKEKYNTISNRPKPNDKNRLKMKSNKFMKSYKSLGNLKYIENKNKSIIKENKEFKKDNNLYYKSPTERNNLMGRTISNGFGLKKLNNELYIYNKKL